MSVDFSFSLKKLYYLSHSLCYFSGKIKLAAINTRFFYKGLVVPYSKRTYHAKIQVFLCMSIFSDIGLEVI